MLQNLKLIPLFTSLPYCSSSGNITRKSSQFLKLQLKQLTRFISLYPHLEFQYFTLNFQKTWENKHDERRKKIYDQLIGLKFSLFLIVNSKNYLIYGIYFFSANIGCTNLKRQN